MAEVRPVQEIAMRRIFVGSAVALLVMTFVVAEIAPSTAKTVVTPAERCSRLGRQVDEAIKTNASATRVAEAGPLRRKAVQLCASGKRAQGIRTYAQVLKLLGVKPIDTDL